MKTMRPSGRYAGSVSSPETAASHARRRVVLVAVSYSQMPQLGSTGLRMANTIFAPSNDTSGWLTSPWPLVRDPVTLVSVPLGEDLSRMKRSPPCAVVTASVGLPKAAVGRLMKAMATSPPTVIESVLVPLQAARAATKPASVQAMLRVLRVRLMFTSVRSLAGVRSGRFPVQPGRVVHASIAVDDHRVDSRQRLYEPDALLGSLDEPALGNAFGRGRVGTDDGDAAHAARRCPGLRVEDVVIAHAARFEVPLVVSGGGDRGVDQWNPRHHLLFAPWILDADDPRPPALVAQHPAVASRHHQRLRNAARPEQVDAVVHGMALGDAAEVDSDAVAGKADSPLPTVQLDVPVVDRRQRGRDAVGRGPRAVAVVEQASDAREGDIERALRQLRELDRALDQREHLRADRDGRLRRLAVEPRQLALGLERAHCAVDAVHLIHHSVHGRFAARRVLVPQLDAYRRAHDRLLPAHPASSSGRGRECKGAADLRRRFKRV